MPILPSTETLVRLRRRLRPSSIPPMLLDALDALIVDPDLPTRTERAAALSKLAELALPYVQGDPDLVEALRQLAGEPVAAKDLALGGRRVPSALKVLP